MNTTSLSPLCRIDVASGTRQFHFSALIHKSDSPADFYLPVAFYERLLDGVPKGRHYEIEIIEPDADFFTKHQLVMNKSEKSQNPFVPYGKEITALWYAQEAFRIWCVGTVSTIERRVDFLT